VYNGFWFAPEREALQVYFDHVASSVTGTARVKLYKGSATVVGRKAPKSLYDKELVTFERDSVYNQADAGAFIKLSALRLRVRSRVEAKENALEPQKAE
ncbi:MAG: argininosuccinate synthase, partial [Pseudopedobacter sp.]|nr:argininosuccinate synthase [Deinococcales bacterium]